MKSIKPSYLSALGLAALNKRPLRQAALVRAHDIRKFEIEFYWKRATYFWVLQASVFTAFGLILKDGLAAVWGPTPVALAALGFLTAVAGYFSARGSKFWQSNWEAHIDMLEDEFEGRLHKTIWVGPRGVSWSVSGMNDRLSLCFAIFWIFLLILAVLKTVGDGSWHFTLARQSIDWNRTIVLILCAGAASAALGLWSRISDLRGVEHQFPLAGGTAPVQSWPRLTKKRGVQASLLERERA